jgi:membrane fusion protein (multidrug efflux system)
MYQVELLKAQAEVKGAEIELQNTKMLADKTLCLKKQAMAFNQASTS